MKKTITTWKQWLRLGAALLVAGTLLYACRPDEAYYDPLPSRSGSILNELKGNANYSLFVQAAERAGLRTALGDGAGVFTVFVPNNQALQALLQANNITSVESAPLPLLRQIVGNHVVSTGLLYPYDLQTFRFNTRKDNRYPTLQGERFLTVDYKSASDFTVNGVKVTGDVNATGNGVYYFLDQALPVQRSADSLINTTAQYSEFAKMVNRFKFRVANPRLPYVYSFDGTRVDTNFIQGTTLAWNLRSDEQVVTLFAPTNDAVRTFLTANGYTRVEELPAAAVQAIVQNHIATPPDRNTYMAPLQSSALREGQAIRTASGTVVVGTDLPLNSVVQANQVVSNGIVHGINRVLVPTIFTRTYGRAFLDANLTIWSTIFNRAEAAVPFNGNETNKEGYTILAPSDAAFIAAGITQTAANAMTKATAEGIVYGHTVGARNFSAADFVANTAYRTYAGPNKLYVGAGKFQSVGGKTVSVTKADVKGTFGVLHTIDGLLDR